MGTYSQQQLQAYIKFTEAREMLNNYEQQLADACLLYTSGGQRGLGVHQLPVRKACKGPVQDLGGLPVNVVEVRTQHYQPVGVADVYKRQT